MTLIGAIRRILADDSTLRARVSGRIYESELATLVNPVLPCVNIKIVSSLADPTVPEATRTDTLRVWCWSEESFDDAREIADLVIDRLNQNRYTESSLDLWFRLAGEPTDYFLEEPRFYCAIVDFGCRVLDRR